MFGMWDAIYARLLKGMVKSVQRGTTAGAGRITINAVNPSKTVVISRSKGSAGYVAARGHLDLSPYNPNSIYWGTYSPNTTYGGGASIGGWAKYSGDLSDGSTDLTTKEYSATLVNSTTISCDGPVEWQVIEFV